VSLWQCVSWNLDVDDTAHNWKLILQHDDARAPLTQDESLLYFTMCDLVDYERMA
jgi:hypothetical protein